MVKRKYKLGDRVKWKDCTDPVEIGNAIGTVNEVYNVGKKELYSVLFDVPQKNAPQRTNFSAKELLLATKLDEALA